MEIYVVSFHTVNETESAKLMQNLIENYKNEKIIIARSIDKDKEISQQDNFILSQKKFIINDQDGNSYNLAVGLASVKGKPTDPNSLEDPGNSNE